MPVHKIDDGADPGDRMPAMVSSHQHHFGSAGCLRDRVGQPALGHLVNGLVALMGQGAAVFEIDGSIVADAAGSSYCQLLKRAGACLDAPNQATQGDPCYDSCWTCTARPALMQARETSLASSACGLSVHAQPVSLNGRVRGVVVFCHGTPPQDEADLAPIAARFSLPLSEVAAAARARDSRAPVPLDAVQTHVAGMARLIARLVEAEETKDALQASEVSYRTLVEDQSDLVVRLDATGCFDYVSPAWCRTFGANPDEMRGAPYDIVTEPEDLPCLHEAFAALAHPPHKARVEARALTAAGTRWMSWTGTGILNDAGAMVAVIAVGRDIHDRKMTEDALKASEERFRILFEEASWGILLHDADGRLVDVNPIGCATLGYTRDEFFALTLADLDADYERNRCRPVAPTTQDHRSAPVPEEGEVIDGIHMPSRLFEARLRRKDGTVVPILVSRNVVRMNGESLVMATGQDISARKQVEAALREAATILEEAQRIARLGHIVFSIPEGRWTCSDPMRDLLGIAVIHPHRRRDWLALIHPEDRGAMRAGLVALARTPERAVFDQVYRIIRPKDGALRWIHGRGRAVRDEDGRVTSIIGTALDITETRQTEEVMRRAMDRLARSNKDLEQFAYAASHDLQEPLRMIAAYAQLLQRRYGAVLDESGGEFLAYILDAAHRMRALVLDLLEYSRAASRPQNLELVDLSAVLATVCGVLRGLIADSGGAVTVESLPQVRGDGVQLASLFQNLISNALKFHRPDQPPRVRVWAEPVPGQGGHPPSWAVRVADNGIGIARENRAAVFDVFKRLHSSQEVPGTGIGLAIVKRIVERHQGSITVEDTPGGGTTFVVTLPVDPEDP